MSIVHPKLRSLSPHPSPHSMHPLLNKLVLENLFSHLDDGHLLKCRLVCRLWNREANRFLRLQRLVNFSGANTKHVYSFLNLMKPYYNKQDGQGQNLDMNMIPFGRFSIQIWDLECFRSRFLSLPGYSEDFFNEWGQHVKYLQLSFNDFKDTVFERKYRDWFLGKLSGSLKCLELNGLSSFVAFIAASAWHGQQRLTSECIFEDGEPVRIFPHLETIIMTDAFEEREESLLVEEGHRVQRFSPRFMSDLLRMAPILKSLTINTCENASTSTGTRTQASLTSSTLQVLKSCCPIQLQNLHLQTLIDEQQLGTIRSCGFRLKSCELRFRTVGTGTAGISNHIMLQEFLRAQSGTLRHFSLEVGIRQDSWSTAVARWLSCLSRLNLIFPVQMTLLASLILNGPIDVNLCGTIFTDSPTMLPCLQKLSLTCGASIHQLCPHESHQLSTLHTLRFEESVSESGAEMLVHGLTHWKSLRCLRLELLPHIMLGVLWKHGGAIEELELVLGDGGADDVRGELETVLNTKEESASGNSILNLTGLRRLVISHANPTRLLDISDDLLFAFAKNLRRLSSLTVRNPKISEAGYKCVKEIMQLKHLDLKITKLI